MTNTILNDGVFKGSDKNLLSVKAQIAKRWGDDEAENYKPLENCLTFKTWRKRGYSVRKGEKAIKCLTYIKKAVLDDNEEVKQIISFPKFVNLFYIKQVEPVRDKMSDQLKKLCNEGLDAANFRGHDMELVKVNKPDWASYRCRVCKKGFTADTKPAPNGIDLGGEALALHCN